MADTTREILMKFVQVSKTYVMGEVKVDALKEVYLEIYKGELLVILGPSGSGKSTLLNISHAVLQGELDGLKTTSRSFLRFFWV